MDEEFLGYWRKFQELGFQCIMGAGFPTNLNGHLRTTGDVNVSMKDTLENRRILIRV